jgi:hypothetical protein
VAELSDRYDELTKSRLPAIESEAAVCYAWRNLHQTSVHSALNAAVANVKRLCAAMERDGDASDVVPAISMADMFPSAAEAAKRKYEELWPGCPAHLAGESAGPGAVFLPEEEVERRRRWDRALNIFLCDERGTHE